MELSAKMQAQIELLGLLRQTFDGADIPWWLFGGWGLDARLGRITRDHGDIEVWVPADQADRSMAVLVAAGFEVLDTQPVEESREYVFRGTQCSTAFFTASPDGTLWQPEGRWSDWRLPKGSFGADRCELEGLRVPVMSAAGMLAMKDQYPSLRNGRPLRPKDERDIPILRELALGEAGASDAAHTARPRNSSFRPGAAVSKSRNSCQ